MEEIKQALLKRALAMLTSTGSKFAVIDPDGVKLSYPRSAYRLNGPESSSAPCLLPNSKQSYQATWYTNSRYLTALMSNLTVARSPALAHRSGATATTAPK